MKRIIITLIVVAGALAGIVYVLNKNKEKNEAITAEAAVVNSSVAVRVDTASTQHIDLKYVANGTFQPKQEVKVSAEAAGRVVRVLVEEGAYVRAGQTLAVVQGDKLNVNVANAEVNLNAVKQDLDRFENAFKTGGVTKQQLDQARLQYDVAKNNLQSAKLVAGDVTIKTSVSGIVNSRKIEPGSYVNAGTEAFDIVNVATLKLRVNVDEKNVASLKEGQQVEVGASVYADKSYTGKITFIAPKSESGLNFPVEIEVPNPNSELRAGMYGTASFGGGSSAVDVLVVPRLAFVGSVSDNKVFVVRDGKAIATQVHSGRTFGNYVEVLGGIEIGDQVIISGHINVFDKTPVTIIK